MMTKRKLSDQNAKAVGWLGDDGFARERKLVGGKIQGCILVKVWEILV